MAMQSPTLVGPARAVAPMAFPAGVSTYSTRQRRPTIILIHSRHLLLNERTTDAGSHQVLRGADARIVTCKLVGPSLVAAARRLLTRCASRLLRAHG